MSTRVAPSCPPALVAKSVLGQGVFGVVYKARAADDADAPPVAVKVVRSSTALADAREVQLLLRVGARPPHIAELLYCWASHDAYHMVFPLYPSTLKAKQKAIRTERAMPVALVRRMCRELLEALVFLRARGILHRDIKPNNVLVDERLSLKLCDFGCGCVEAQDAKSVEVNARCYRAPELHLGCAHYSHEIDLFSAGATMAEFACAEPLFWCPTSEAGSVLMRMLAVMGPAGAGFAKRVADPAIAAVLGRRLEMALPVAADPFEGGPPAFSAFIRRALVWECRPLAAHLLRDDAFLNETPP